jgi:hypothetical protein
MGFIILLGELQTFLNLFSPVINKTAVSFNELAASVPDFLARLIYLVIGAASPLPGFIFHLVAGVLKRHPGSLSGYQKFSLDSVPSLLTRSRRHQEGYTCGYQTSQ